MPPQDPQLTLRQAEILAFIREHMATEARPPTRAELCTAFGFRSPNAAETHLRALAAKGAIRLDEGRARGIRLTEPDGLPLVGRVAAGSPILAAEHIQGHYPVDARLFKPRADYLLQVRGMSMRDAGILDGDLLAVHSTRQARHGQVVVARLGDEVTVKTFALLPDHIELLPANPDFDPIRIDPERDELVIEGIAVGLLRNGMGG